ncbi:MAG: WYL domain-containing protein, partial [Oscillospiraceae bacterium]|nr:WYL domain-containing protein [Oscillospiraceae bacterium]
RWQLQRKLGCMSLMTADSRELVRNPTHIFYNHCNAAGIDAVFFLTLMLKGAEWTLSDEEGFQIGEIMDWIDTDWSRQMEKLESAEQKKAFRDNTQHKIRERLRADFEQLGLLRSVRSGNNKKWQVPSFTMDALLGSVWKDGRPDDEAVRGLLAVISFFSKTGPFGEVGSHLLDRLTPGERKEAESRHIRQKQFYLAKSLNDFNLADLLQAMERDGWVLITHYDSMDSDRKGCIFCKPLQIRSSAANGREYVCYYDPIYRRVCSLRADRIQSVELLDEKYIPWLLAAAWKEPCIAHFVWQHPRLCHPGVFHEAETEQIKFVRYVGKGRRARAVLAVEEATGGFCYASEYRGAQLLEEGQKRLEGDLRQSDRLLEQTWGVSIPYYRPDETLWEVRPVTVRLVIYQWAGEEHIKRRVARECRSGSWRQLSDRELEVTLEVTDPYETIPWIMSFAGRLRKAESSDPEFCRTLKARLRETCRAYLGEEEKEEPVSTAVRKQYYHNSNILRDGMEAYHQGRLRNPSPLLAAQTPLHEELFCKLFSLEYRNCMQGYQRLAQQIDQQLKGGTPRERNAMAAKLWQEQVTKENVDLLDADCLKELAGTEKEEDRYSAREYQRILARIPAICEAGAELRTGPLAGNGLLMRDLIPLTGLEKRWLLSILGEEKTRLFLEPGQIEAFRNALLREGKVLPLYRKGAVCLYDQYRQPELTEEDRKHFRLLFSAAQAKRSVKVCYRPGGGDRVRELTVLPLWLEYAQRDDLFRVICLSRDEEGQLKQITLSLRYIEGAELLSGEKGIPRTEAVEIKGEEMEVVLRFSTERNVPDRILTQFAPWRKQCSYLKKEGCYELRFQADESEWLDIGIRLLGFGGEVKLWGPEKLKAELESRLRRQRNLWM